MGVGGSGARVATAQGSKRAVVFVAAISSFLTPFMASSVNIAIPSISAELRMDAVVLSWVATAYLLAAAMFLVPFGRVADIYGRKKVFLWGVVINTIGALFCTFANSAETLIAFRALQGLGGAMLFGTAVALLTSVYPPQERGRALGFNTAAVYAGLSFGPFAGGLLTQYFGWRSVFFVGVPLGLIVIYATVAGLSGEWAEARGEKVDLPGSAAYGLSLASVMYGLTILPSQLGAALIALGVLGLAGFLFWETRARFPVLNVSLFRHNALFAFSNLAALINYSATSAVGFLLSLYLQYLKGLSPDRAGVILIAQPIVMAVFSPLAGRLSDRIEPRLVATAGMCLSVAGLSLLAMLDARSSQEFIIAALVVCGLGFALFSSPNMSAIMGSVERRHYGVAAATLGTMRLIGQMMSMGVATLMVAVSLGRVQITPEYYPVFVETIRTIFLIFTGLCVAGVFASLARGKAH